LLPGGDLQQICSSSVSSGEAWCGKKRGVARRNCWGVEIRKQGICSKSAAAAEKKQPAAKWEWGGKEAACGKKMNGMLRNPYK
jgi:hypothetical protein